MVYFERRFQRRDSMFQMSDVKEGGRMLNTFLTWWGAGKKVCSPWAYAWECSWREHKN